MPNTVLGKVSLVPRGEYDSALSYAPLDLVRYGGRGYVVIRDVQGVTPSDGDDYMLLADKGDTGVSVKDVTRTAGTGAAGTYDTYTITLTDGSIAGTFQVYNGANGNGSGDFLANGSVPMTGALRMGGNPIQNVGAPTEDTDAARMAEVRDAMLSTATATGNFITLTDAAEAPLDALTIYGKTTQDGTPTPEAPVELVSVESPTVEALGKNFLRNRTANTVTNYGITFTKNADGSVSYSGTVTNVPSHGDIWYYTMGAAIYDNAWEVPAGKYTLSAGNDEITCSIRKIYADNQFVNIERKGKVTIEIEENARLHATFGCLNTVNGETYDGVFYPQLERGDIATEYEPYAAQTAAFPYTLRGVPVDSGGNYTDESGQQWVCDTVEISHDGTGKLVRRVKVIDGYAGETVAEPFMSTTGELSTGATVIYAFAAPTETALTSSEIAAFLALSTRKPVTTILNGEGAGLAVEYVLSSTAQAFADAHYARRQELVGLASMADIEAGPIIQSSTAGSTKKFRISVDDSGTITATEVTA